MSLDSTNLRGNIDRQLDLLLPSADDPIARSMRYSLLTPGKRLRPLMTQLAAAAFGGREQVALIPGCAIEMIHTASLILDDMPSMDNARLRRGRPANHIQFGENVATLAAFALLNRAYAIVAADESLASEIRIRIVQSLTTAVGEQGIIAGQMSDLSSDRHTTDTAQVNRIHRQKTGSLFVAAVECGALAVGVPERQLGAVRAFGTNFGLCFQALDDLADRHGTETAQGKDVRQDARKATLVSTLGKQATMLAAERFASAATRALDPLGTAGHPLVGLTQSLLETARRPPADH